jgi:DNA helicase HerA-like ATPase
VPLGLDKTRLDLGIKRKIYWHPARASPHVLVAGQSGSGKTKFLELFASRCVRDLHNCELFLADPKCIDFAYIRGSPNFSENTRFWSGEDSGRALEVFKASMMARVNQTDTTTHWKVLIFDEIAAFTLLQTDKKKRSELQDIMASILLLGRGVRHVLIVGVQKALMEFFGTGGRSQFGTTILLGSTESDKEQVQMLMSPHKDVIQATPNSRGQFWVTMDGEGIRRGQTPWITKQNEVQNLIIEGLNRNAQNDVQNLEVIAND